MCVAQDFGMIAYVKPGGVLRQAQSIGSKQEGLARDSFHVDHDSMQHYPARSKGEYFGPWSLTDRSCFAACVWGDAPVRILNFRRELFHHILTPILFRTIASTPAFNRAVKNHRSLFIFIFSCEIRPSLGKKTVLH